MGGLSSGGKKENQNTEENIQEMRARDPNTQNLLKKYPNKIIQRITFFDKLGGKFTGKTSERGMTNAKHALDSMNHFQQPPNNMVVCIGGKLIKIIFGGVIVRGLYQVLNNDNPNPVKNNYLPQQAVAENQTLATPNERTPEHAKTVSQTERISTKKQAPVQKNQPIQQAINYSSRPAEDTQAQNTEIVRTEILPQDEEYRDPFEVKVQYYIEVLQKYIDEHTNDLIKGANRNIANRELRDLQSTEIQKQRKAVSRIEDSLNKEIELYEEDQKNVITLHEDNQNTLYIEFGRSGTDNPAS